MQAAAFMELVGYSLFLMGRSRFLRVPPAFFPDGPAAGAAVGDPPRRAAKGRERLS